MKSLREKSPAIGKVFAVGVLLLTLPSAAHAALMVQDSDITTGNFTYDLTFQEMDFGGSYDGDPQAVSEFAGPLESWAGIDWRSGGDGRYLSASDQNGTEASPATAGFTLKFDFTESSYRPTAVTFHDNIEIIGNESGTVLVEYSIDDGSSWNQLRYYETATADGSTYDVTQTTPLALSAQPDTVSYRVTFTAVAEETSETSYDGDWGFKKQRFNWNRLSSDDTTNYYYADFTLTPVPEPASLTLLGIGGLMMLSRWRR